MYPDIHFSLFSLTDEMRYNKIFQILTYSQFTIIFIPILHYIISVIATVSLNNHDACLKYTQCVKICSWWGVQFELLLFTCTKLYFSLSQTDPIRRDCGELQESQEERYIVQPYETMLLKAGIKPLPILQVIVSKLLHASESMDLLMKMGRLTKTRGMCYSYSFGHSY